MKFSHARRVSEWSVRLIFVSIALYRRYRPQTFQEVIGQDHVVKPLQAALAGGRTTHAYLFSGPRGCGKTTSARILARCLNCIEYPTDTPCGTCESCIELSRDGSGSLDVVELDAASHGGVDDARELREQAGFAPVRDRFKIFIIDEAHMVSNQGFNALLKLVEEPPEHVKFIFATTEPEKVIGTIRSRTHHYPFRLVPPNNLEAYLAQLCAREGVSAGKDVLSLVVRAGTGSVRDTLSVLDQIIGGSDSYTLDYDRAVALLGYTSANLLDDAVTAIAQRDGASLFGVVDSVVKSGHDPRRFVEDLLQRLRDLVIISLAGDSAHDVFVSVPEDQYARMVEQAELLGAARGSRCADLTNDALTAMVGATAPRLQLELLCARLIVAQAPGSPEATGGVAISSASVEGGQVVAPSGALSKWKKPSPQEAASAKAAPQQPPMQQPMVHEQPSQQPAQPPVQQPPVDPQLAQPPVDPQPPVRERDGQQTAPQQTQPAETQRIETSIPPVPPRKVADLSKAAQAENEVTSQGPGNPELEAIRKQWSSIIASPNLNGLAKNQLQQSLGPIALKNNVLVIGFAIPSIAQRFNDRTASKFAQFLANELKISVQVEGRPHDPKDDAARGAATESTASLHAADTEPVYLDDNPEPYLEDETPESPYVTPDPVIQSDDDTPDPAGVLGPLVDGTAVIIGDDHTQTATRTSEPAHQTPRPEVVPVAEPEPLTPVAEEKPFYAFDMPSVPPLTPPQPGGSSSNTANEPRWKPPVHQQDVAVTPPPLEQSRATAVERRPTRSWEIHPPTPADRQEEPADEWDEVSMDDPDINQSNLVGIQVLLKAFDAKIVEEIPDGKRDN